VLSILSCHDDKSYGKHRIGNFLVEGNFIKDSIMDGKMKYFDTSGTLVATVIFQNGIKQGPSLDYYLNGKVQDSVFFTRGQKEGFHYIYDSSGELSYIDYYLRGHSIGPVFYYDHGKVKKYYFTNFEKQPIYVCSYDSSGRMFDEKGEVNFVMPLFPEVNNKSGLNIFAYIINPPKVDINYFLYMKDSTLNKDSIIAKFDNSKIIIDTVLNVSTDSRFTYFYKAEYFDSTNQNKKVFITKLVP
jgi:hypothetical protein